MAITNTRLFLPSTHPIAEPRSGAITAPWLSYFQRLVQAVPGQGAGNVSQSGNVTPGHLATWSGDGVIVDGGPVPSGGGGITQLTGDVTAGPGSGSQVATIAALAVTTSKLAASAVTYAKLQNVSANAVLLGSSAIGAGAAPTEITLGTNLSMSGSTLNVTTGGLWIPAVAGDEPPTFLTDGAGVLLLVAA